MKGDFAPRLLGFSFSYMFPNIYEQSTCNNEKLFNMSFSDILHNDCC